MGTADILLGVDGLVPHSRGAAILLVASSYRKWANLPSFGLPVAYSMCDFALPLFIHLDREKLEQIFTPDMNHDINRNPSG